RIPKNGVTSSGKPAPPSINKGGSRNHNRAAVRGDRLPRHVAGVVAKKERDHRGNILRTADAAHRDPCAGGVELVVAHLDARLRRVGEPRNDAIHADAVGGPVERQRFRKCDNATLAGGVMRSVGRPASARPEAVLTMAPRPKSFMRAATARAVTNVPVRLTRSTSSHSASLISSARARGKIPALLTSPSGLPQARSKADTAASIASASPTSTVQARATAPFS